MRTKTEEKRQNIVDVAATVFAQMGFERASMAEICTRVGGSKATLYNYFASKEALFMEVVFQASEADFYNTIQALQSPGTSVRTTLERFGVQMLTLLYAPNVSAMRRLLVAEGGRNLIGQQCWERGPSRGNEAIATYLKSEVANGRLKKMRPELATRQLLSLLEAELFERWVFHQDMPTAKEISACAKRGVAAFLAIYGVVEQAT